MKKHQLIIGFILSVFFFHNGISQNNIEIVLTENKSFSNEFYEDDYPLFVFINKMPNTDLTITSNKRFKAIFKEENIYKVYLDKSNQILNIKILGYDDVHTININTQSLKFKEVRVYEVFIKDLQTQENHFGASTEVNALSIFNSKWKGFYYCRNNRTELDFEISQKNDIIYAYFDFSIKNIKGSYLLTGVYNSKRNRLVFTPDSWIKKPAGYVMVGLSGSFNKNNTVYEGKVTNSACSSFYLERIKD